MLTLAKTIKPLNTMTREELKDWARRYDNLSWSSEHWGKWRDANKYASLAIACDRERDRRALARARSMA